MQLAYSSNGFTEVSLVEAIHRIARHGYAGVEILADIPHLDPTRLSATELASIRSALSDSGVSVSNINANTAAALWPIRPPEPVFEPSLSNHDPEVRATRRRYSQACLALAAEIGAPAISVTSGRTESGVPPSEGFALFADSLAGICRDAERFGVRVGIEYEPGLLVESADEVAALIACVDHPLLGVNLDVGHAICAGESPEASIAALAGRIWNVHLEDIRGRKHYHLVPGEGDVDFDAVFGALGRAGYRGFVTVELYTCANRADDAAAAAFAHLAPRLGLLDAA